MVKSRKYRKNIMKKKVNRSTRSGGDPPAPISTIHNPLSDMASSGLSGLSAAGSDGINGIIGKLKSFAECNLTTKALFAAFKMPGVITQAVEMINIPSSFDAPLQLILKNQTTVNDLLIDILTVFKCSDSAILAEALEKVFVIDQIGKLLKTPNLSNMEEAAKNSLPLFKEIKDIIISEKFQDLLGRVLNEMETKKHINSEQKKAFILFFVGEGKEGEDTANKILQGNSILGAVSSLFGNASGSESAPILDPRCGLGEEVEKSILWGKDRCVLSDLPKPPAAAPVEGEPTEGAPAEGEPTPSPVEKEGEAPAVEPTPSPVEKEGEAPAVEPTPSPVEKEGEAPAVEPTPSPAEKEQEEAPPPTTEGGQKKKGWFWGGKYKRVKHTKKSKKSKSKKSKSKKSKRSKK
jgi:hypothetical protein